MASCVSMGAVFLGTIMFAGERFSLPLATIAAALVVAAIVLFKRRSRDTAFRWDVPWNNVVAFEELENAHAWAVTLKGPDAGTLQFSIGPDSGSAFAELMVSVQETGLSKVRFVERVVPEARVVSRD